MVSVRWGGLAARAAHLMASFPGRGPNAASHSENALRAAEALQGWYDVPSGLWATTGWWNSANCLIVLMDWALHAGTNTGGLDVAGIVANTFKQAQQVSVSAQKRLSPNGLMTSAYELHPATKRGFSEFLNDFYDDEGWWALALIRSWDVTGEAAYLDMAERIFEDMQNGTDATCGGGIWWSKERAYKNAITNELYLSVAASLANRIDGGKERYARIARDAWTWFRRSGMINENHLINDGLRIEADGRCVNNGLNTWSYNQGVVLGGLVELARATGDSSYLAEAGMIARAAIARLSDADGIIHEVDGCEPHCGNDGSQFKGVFVRNLRYLHGAAPQDAFETAIRKNADSIWDRNRNPVNQLGIAWTGPPDLGDGPNAATHSSAMDVIVAAMVVGP